jgi:hypothetical protein
MKIIDEYFRQRSDVLEASQTPRTITFNHAGYSRAMKEEQADTCHFNMNPGTGPRTYGGLPYVIDPRQEAKIVVTHEPPHEVDQRVRDSQRRPYQRQNAITVKIDGIMSGAPVVEIIAANLTAAQLCDIARAWLDADCQKWGDFEKELDAVIVKHGRFE